MRMPIMSMGEAFRHPVSQHPRREALVCGDLRLTYGQIGERIAALACSLQRLGVGKGDRVAVVLLPGPEFVTLFFALAEMGAVMVPIDPLVRYEQLNYLLADSEPMAVIISKAQTEQATREGGSIEGLCSKVPGLRHIILTDGNSEADLLLASMTSAKPDPSFRPPDVAPDDLLTILYTSGTTGTPKGTMHSHRTLLTPVLASLKLREMRLKKPSLKTAERWAKGLSRYGQRLLRAAGRPQIFLSTMGYHTITGLEVMLQALLMGDKLVIMPKFHPRHALRLIERERITVLVAVPTALSILLRMQDLSRYDLSSLLICGTGSAPCPPHLAHQIQQQLGCALHIGFGTTELAGGVTATSLDDPDDLQAETVGQTMPGMQVKIVDHERRELPPGRTGELACRSDSMMLGYWRAPEKMAEITDKDGWFYTGDLATIDERGYVRIVGRKKDMIIRGGQNIYPAEVERHLVVHENIREAAVVGVPATIGGERTWAFLILEPGVEMTTRELFDYCRSRMEVYQIPDKVRFVSDFPRTASGKPQKFKLREMALQEISEHDNRTGERSDV